MALPFQGWYRVLAGSRPLAARSVVSMPSAVVARAQNDDYDDVNAYARRLAVAGMDRSALGRASR